MQRYCIKRNEFYQVVEHLRKLGQKTIRENRWSAEDVARRFTTDLGFQIKRSHLRVAVATLGWTSWPSTMADAMLRVKQAEKKVVTDGTNHPSIEAAIREAQENITRLLTEIRDRMTQKTEVKDDHIL